MLKQTLLAIANNVLLQMKGNDYGTDLYESRRLLHPEPHPDDDTECEIGVYDRIRQRFLEEYHHGTYISLLLTGKL